MSSGFLGILANSDKFGFLRHCSFSPHYWLVTFYYQFTDDTKFHGTETSGLMILILPLCHLFCTTSAFCHCDTDIQLIRNDKQAAVRNTLESNTCQTSRKKKAPATRGSHRTTRLNIIMKVGRRSRSGGALEKNRRAHLKFVSGASRWNLCPPVSNCFRRLWAWLSVWGEVQICIWPS